MFLTIKTTLWAGTSWVVKRLPGWFLSPGCPLEGRKLFSHIRDVVDRDC